MNKKKCLQISTNSIKNQSMKRKNTMCDAFLVTYNLAKRKNRNKLKI